MELILAHPNSDFDALAAQHAAALLYAGAVPVLAPQLNDNVAEFVGLHRDEFLFVEQSNLPAEPVTRLILVDTQRIWGRWDLEQLHECVVIDHHPLDESSDLPEPATLIVEPCGATVTLLIGRLLEADVPLSATEATLFLLGIYEDTGNLTFESTTISDVSSVVALLERGADLSAVRRYSQRGFSPDQEEAYHALVPNLHIGEIAGWTVLTGWAALDRNISGLAVLASRLRDVYGPAALVIALGVGSNGTQLIARADPDVLDVGTLMEHFGGGGHAVAASAFVRGEAPEAVIANLNRLIPASIKPALTAAQMMSQPVTALRDTLTITEAAALLRRWDYSALPVVDEEGRLCGDLGRREVQKAQRHGLSDAPIRRYWWRSPATVPPTTTAGELRRLLAAEERGRVYVVDDDRRVLGVITRGDLLHHTERGTAHGPLPDEGLAGRFEQALASEVAAHVALAGEIAGREGWGLYAVGGFVRDLLLGRPPGDLDLVIEGDAVAVARELAQATGGTLRTHLTFGTATVEWGSAEGETHLDFITARTEFYEHPTALPEVEAASLRHDLHRRDFTINTLALALTPARRGHLYDFYGGARDLERGLIRVLHNLSFIDDPTRLLRAVRLAARLSFVIEERTGELIADAITQDVLHRTTPARIRHELRLLLEEPDPLPALALLAETGLLQSIHPSLRWDEPRRAHCAAALDLKLPHEARRDVLLLVLFAPLSAAERVELAERYQLPARQRQRIIQWNELAALEDRLRTLGLTAGLLDQLLAPFDELVLESWALVVDDQLAQSIRRYLTTLRPTSSFLGGKDLLDAGLPPGPRYAQILTQARIAQLDEGWTTSAEARRWLDDYLAQGGDHGDVQA